MIRLVFADIGEYSRFLLFCRGPGDALCRDHSMQAKVDLQSSQHSFHGALGSPPPPPVRLREGARARADVWLSQRSHAGCDISWHRQA